MEYHKVKGENHVGSKQQKTAMHIARILKIVYDCMPCRDTANFLGVTDCKHLASKSF